VNCNPEYCGPYWSRGPGGLIAENGDEQKLLPFPNDPT
jgi:hypothetical protein